MKYLYHLKDEGQDLIWVEITDDKITRINDGAYDIGILGMFWYNYYTSTTPKPLKKGQKIRYSAGPAHSVFTLKYPIVKVVNAEAKEELATRLINEVKEELDHERRTT